MIDAPDKNVMSTEQLKSKQTPGWSPYAYKYRILTIGKEEEWKMHYSRFRKHQITYEKAVEDTMLALAAG